MKLMKLFPLRYSASQQSGFSLIELMVAMVLGLLMMISVIQLYAGISRNNSDMASTNEQIENGRFVLQMLEKDVVHGGFWSGYIPQFDDLTYMDIPGDIPPFIPPPCLAFANWNTGIYFDKKYLNGLVAIPVQTYDAVPAGCEAIVLNKKPNTDVLVVRHADTCVAGDVGCEADTTATPTPKVYFQAQLCGNTADTAYNYKLDIAGFTYQKRDCITTADKRKYVSNIYWVTNDNVLMRAEFGGAGGSVWAAGQPLIEGVEGFDVELGVDDVSQSGANILVPANSYALAANWPAGSTSPTNRGNGAPDRFVHCTTLSPCTLDDLINVVSTKIYVLVRSNDVIPGYLDHKTYKLGSTPLGPFDDNVKRHVYSTTVRLNNVSGRRQTP